MKAKQTTVLTGSIIAVVFALFVIVTAQMGCSAKEQDAPSNTRNEQNGSSRTRIAIPEISSGDAMSPDQETFNAVWFLAISLEAFPFVWQEPADIVRQYNQSAMNSDTKALVSDFLALCEQLGGLERRIEQRRISESQEASSVSTSAGFSGGLNGVGIASGIDRMSQENGGDGLGLLGYVIAGAIGGAIESSRQTARINEATNNDIADMQRKMEVLVKDFGHRLDEYQAGATFASFDKDRVLPFLDFEAPSARRAVFRCKLPELTLFMNGDSNLKDRGQIHTAYIVEWPSSRKIDCEKLAKSYWVLADDAVAAGKNEEGVALADKGLSLASNFGDLYEVRGLAKLHSGKSRDAKVDIERAIAINPQDGSYEVSMARVLVAGYRDKEGALSAIQRAYRKGFCYPEYIKSKADFDRIRNDSEFVRLTTVNVSWGHTEGLVFSDIWMRNDSPFTITSARLSSTTSGWQWSLPSEGTITLSPGERYSEGWYPQPPPGRTLGTTISCDQIAN